MALLNEAPMPTQDPIAQIPRRDLRRNETDPRENLPTQPWIEWLSAISSAVNASAGVLQTVSLSEQGASIGATPLAPGTTDAGTFRLTYYARITTPATTSSTLTVTIGFTDNGVVQSVSGAAMTGNTTTTVQSASFLLTRDQATPMTFSTTYGSVGATAMLYKLVVKVEKL